MGNDVYIAYRVAHTLRLFSRLFHSPSVQLEVMDVENFDLHFPDISDAEINEETC